ncbi:hypothetical protein K458DRAFT_384751 [Lentithecium fluviatile CBS 122367]|uniref:Uncharacterized protein n=1 Tax=Lentithecium fluviatile CBS 122367 TaxID=1168545 RepID=A0A6G1JEL6_9PLEO|nr:hypothetical protein K458DRAFT_384751 [Lentithecium fluviatile CBS 122367]
MNHLDGRSLQHGLDVVFSNIPPVSCSHSKLLSPLMQFGSDPSLREEQEDGDREWGICEPLDPLNLPPAQGLIDEAGIDRSSNWSEDRDEAEHGHGLTALVRLVHVLESAADQDRSDAAENSN